MNITYAEFSMAVKTRSEESSVVRGLFLSRSVIGIQINNTIQPLLGFGASFNRQNSESRSQYELLEHMIFLPHIHSDKSMKKPPVYLTNGINSKNSSSIKSFFIGAPSPRGSFTANGCAISTSMDKSINHSRNELLERHICCQIWYDRTRPLLSVNNFNLDVISNKANLNFYTTNTDGAEKFGLVSLECAEIGFFTLGAAVKADLDTALIHAASEAIMLFEDANKKRLGTASMGLSKNYILSLRDRDLSMRRKAYLQKIIDKPLRGTFEHDFNCETICFEPLPSIYAARSLSSHALDPKQFTNLTEIPILPLF